MSLELHPCPNNYDSCHTCRPVWGAGQVASCFVVTPEVYGQLFTGVAWSIIWSDIIIFKFYGIMSGSIRLVYFTSRVGIQCWVRGVCKHTSMMFLRCQAP